MKRDYFLLYLGSFLIILFLNLLLYHNYTTNVDACLSDPIKFGVEKIKENYNATLVTGSITMLTPQGPKGWDFGDVNLSDEKIKS